MTVTQMTGINCESVRRDVESLKRMYFLKMKGELSGVLKKTPQLTGSDEVIETEDNLNEEEMVEEEKLIEETETKCSGTR